MKTAEILTNLPNRVVASAFSLMEAKFSSTHRPNSRALAASSNMKTGERCMYCSMTAVFTPPHSVKSRIPRL